MNTSDIIIILSIVSVALLIYMYNKPSETYKIIPENIHTSYCDIDIVDSRYTKLNSRKVFCFVLFKNATEDSHNNYMYNYTDNINNPWYKKYLKTQLDQFYRLLENKHWKEYCILHFIDKITLDYVIPELNITVRDYILSYVSKFPKCRYSMLSYYSENFINPKTGYHYDYFGSLARYISLRMPYFDTVIFRDAHSTMPSRHTNYDVEWRDTWLNRTGYKFWMYNMPNYNPFHTLGEHAMLAGAWAVRKNTDEKYLLNDDLWNATFGQLNSIDNKDFFSKSEYGFDERILLLLSQNKDFINNVYITGLTWSFWLFFPQHNPRTISRFDGDTKNKVTLDRNDFNNVKWYRNKDNIPNLHLDYPLMDQIQPYYRESTCIIKYIDDILNTREYTSVNKLWDTIEQLRQTDCNDDYCSLTKKLTMMIPARNNLWEFIFDTNK